MKNPLMLVMTVVLLAACATPPPPAESEREFPPDLSERIDRICALPPEARAAEVAKLQEETGLVLYCGREPK